MRRLAARRDRHELPGLKGDRFWQQRLQNDIPYWTRLRSRLAAGLSTFEAVLDQKYSPYKREEELLQEVAQDLQREEDRRSKDTPPGATVEQDAFAHAETQRLSPEAASTQQDWRLWA